MNASQIRQSARENLAGNWGISVGVTLVAALLGGVVTGAGGIHWNIDSETIRELPSVLRVMLLPYVSLAGLMGVVTFILGGVVELGHARFLLNQHDHRQLQFSDLFSQFDRFGTGFAQRFLRTLFIVLWSMLLVIPGIVKALSYSMTPFILEEHPEMTVSQGIKASMKLMDGHKMDLFLLSLSFIGWQILACMSFGIGFLFLNPYINAAYAVFYRSISGPRQQSPSYIPPVEF